MKEKLVKDFNNYHLLIEGKLHASTDGNVIGKQKLSLKNCQAIENGYDLGELADEYAKYMNDDDGTSDIDFKVGFQKALEILKDKKFSEDDMHDAVMLGVCFEEPGIQGVSTYNEVKELAIKRATKTEWDVEVEMRPASLVYKTDETLPKLDSDGCLILKRI